MSQGATNIIDGLVWLGSFADASNESFLKSHSIACVINVAEELPNPGIPVEMYVKFPARDQLDFPILQKFSAQVTQTLAECIAMQKPVLIHCAAGINRSATLLADFLYKMSGIHPKDIVYWIRSLRPQTFSNESFLRQLIERQ
jgi:protein-tyrosine phosphatase